MANNAGRLVRAVAGAFGLARPTDSPETPIWICVETNQLSRNSEGRVCFRWLEKIYGKTFSCTCYCFFNYLS